MTSIKTLFQLSSPPEFLGGHVFWWWWWSGPHSNHYTIRECAWLKYFHLPVLLAGRGGHVLQSWPAGDIIECGESWGRCHKGMVSFSQIPLLLPWWLGRWKICPQCGRPSFNPWVGKIPWRRVATYSSILAWRIPWTEESGGLQSMGSQRVFRHDWATNAFTFSPSCLLYKRAPYLVLEEASCDHKGESHSLECGGLP